MARRIADISEAEMEVLKAVWDGGPGTVRDVDARLRPQKRRWAYTTIQTLLNRLEAKGYITSEKSAPAHVFRATVSRERFLRRRLRDLTNELCDGTATPLVMALVRGHRFSEEEIRKFRRLVDSLQAKED